MPEVIPGPVWIEVLRAGQDMTFTMEYADGHEEPFTYTHTEQDLQDMVEAYDPVHAIEGTLGVDHRKGGPAFGWFKSLKKVGTSLWAELRDLQAVAAEAIRTKAYKRISSEIAWNYNGTGKKYFLGATLLGASLPACEGMLPVTLAGHRQAAHLGDAAQQTGHCAADVQQVEIVYPGEDYAPGALKMKLLEDDVRHRTDTILTKAWGIIQNLWWSATLTPAEKVAKVKQVLADASPLVADTAISPGVQEMEGDMTDAQVTALAAQLAASVGETVKAEMAAHAARESTATAAAVADTAREASLLARVAESLPPAASEETRGRALLALRAAAASDAGGVTTGALEATTALLAGTRLAPPRGTAAPLDTDAAVDEAALSMLKADGTRVLLVPVDGATPAEVARLKRAVARVNAAKGFITLDKALIEIGGA